MKLNQNVLFTICIIGAIAGSIAGDTVGSQSFIGLLCLCVFINAFSRKKAKSNWGKQNGR